MLTVIAAVLEFTGIVLNLEPEPLTLMASILLVDDDSSVLLTSSIALRRCGHDVTLACDGLQALQQLNRHQFDFLVSDIRMPGMSGLELAARVNALPQAPRVVLTSAHYDPDLQPNPAAIADAFLQKPLDIDALCHLLERDDQASAMNHRGAYGLHRRSVQQSPLADKRNSF